MARGPGGSIEKIGKLLDIGSTMEAVSVPGPLGGAVDEPRVLTPNREEPKPVEGVVLIAGATGFCWPNNEPPKAPVPVVGWAIVC